MSEGCPSCDRYFVQDFWNYCPRCGVRLTDDPEGIDVGLHQILTSNGNKS